MSCHAIPPISFHLIPSHLPQPPHPPRPPRSPHPPTNKKKNPQDWTSGILPHLSIHSHSSAPPHPQITFLFTVQPEHTNGLGNLHGGCTATVFDLCTSLPLGLVARPGFWLWLGVSRTLNVTYLRPIPAGSVVRVECELQQVGRKMCTVRGVMRMAEGDGKGGPGPALAVCEHGKINTDPPVEKL